MNTDSPDDEPLGWEPLLSAPLKVAGGLVLASFVPCLSLSTTTSSTVNGVTVSHTTNYGPMLLALAAIAASGYAGILGGMSPDRRVQRIGIAVGIALVAAARFVWAGGLL
jgi:hypothetical protein